MKANTCAKTPLIVVRNNFGTHFLIAALHCFKSFAEKYPLSQILIKLESHVPREFIYDVDFVFESVL